MQLRAGCLVDSVCCLPNNACCARPEAAEAEIRNNALQWLFLQTHIQSGYHVDVVTSVVLL